MCRKDLSKIMTRFRPLDPLTCLLAVLLVLAIPGLSGANMWDDTIAKAKEEGTLVAVLGGSASRNYRPIFKYFENKFGIRTVVSTGGGRRQADRLLAERGAGKFKVDVVLIGGGSANTRLLPNKVLDPIGPVLFHPEVVDQSLWYKGTHRYSDPEEKYVFAFSANAELTPIGMRFNTNKLPIKEAKKIDSVWTFLDKRFAGQIVSLPPTASGALGTYFTVMVHPDLGPKYLRRMFRRELNVQFSSDFRQIADRVARGKYTMAIFVGSGGRDIDRLGRQGLPVASFTQIIDKPVKERPILQGTGASNNIMVVNRRPHPYAAKLFVNWLLSKEGQTIMQIKSERVPDQSFREDVTEKGMVEAVEMRRPGIEYMTIAHDPQAQKKRIWALKQAVKIYYEVRGR